MSKSREAFEKWVNANPGYTYWDVWQAAQAQAGDGEAPEGWVSVDDRLPEAETPVLAIVDGYDGLLTLERRWEHCNEMVETYYKDFLYWDWVDNDGQDLEGRVKFWMHLPEPPALPSAGNGRWGMSEAINRLGDAKNFVSLGYTHSALMAIDDVIKILQAAQAQASDAVAVADKGVLNWFDGKKFDHEADLYTQPAQVNQQLLEALEAAMNFIDSHAADPDITQEMVENYAALKKTKPYEAIAAAQEQGK